MQSETISGKNFWVIYMYMPVVGNGITNGIDALIGIDTRNADYSATGKDGLLWIKPGLYIFTVEAYRGGNLKEYSSKMMEVLPTGFNNYWVWSASKMRHSDNAAEIAADS